MNNKISLPEGITVVTPDPFAMGCCQSTTIKPCDLDEWAFFYATIPLCNMFFKEPLHIKYQPIVYKCVVCGRPWIRGLSGCLKGKIFRLAKRQ